MLFDFGFNLTPSVDTLKKNNLQKRLSNCETRLKKLSESKLFSREILNLIRDEITLRDELKQQIETTK